MPFGRRPYSFGTYDVSRSPSPHAARARPGPNSTPKLEPGARERALSRAGCAHSLSQSD
jgi:hypothetical protein